MIIISIPSVFQSAFPDLLLNSGAFVSAHNIFHNGNDCRHRHDFALRSNNALAPSDTLDNLIATEKKYANLSKQEHKLLFIMHKSCLLVAVPMMCVSLSRLLAVEFFSLSQSRHAKFNEQTHLYSLSAGRFLSWNTK